MTGLYMAALNSSFSWKTTFCLTGYSTVYIDTLDTTFQEAHLGEDARAFKTAMATSRMTIEWMFK